MTATSSTGCYVRHADSYFADKQPVDASLYQDGLLASLVHLGDEAAQVRVAWVAKDSSSYLTPRSVASTAIWYPVVRYGPFPVSIRADGTSYEWRVRLAAYTSNVHQITFRAALTTLAREEEDVVAYGGNVVEAASSSGTSAWLSPTGGSNTIVLSAPQVEDATTTIPSLAGVGGANVDVEVVWCVLAVWCKTANTGSTPRLTGVYAAEYVG